MKGVASASVSSAALKIKDPTAKAGHKRAVPNPVMIFPPLIAFLSVSGRSFVELRDLG